VHFRPGASLPQRQHVAVEVPVNLVYGTIPYAVMMASPDDLQDFAAGFSLTEGLIRDVREIRSIAVRPEDEGIIVDVTLEPGPFRRHLARRRTLSGRTACGTCGIETIAELPRAESGLRRRNAISADAILASLLLLEERQPLNALTRSVHAAAWCDLRGRIVAVREDVGRHNALDKLIGAVLRAGGDPADGFILITSRASFEMVEKAAAFGTGTLVSISAPTSYAVARAEALGLTLVSIARRDGAVVFAGRLADNVLSECAAEGSAPSDRSAPQQQEPERNLPRLGSPETELV
jgi:FdhD protein